MDRLLKTIVVMDIVAALVAHTWLKRYDPLPLSKIVAALAIIPAVPAYLFSTYLPSALVSIVWAYSVFYLTLIASVVAYRLSPYHPLAQYPGPLILKITKLYSVWIAYTGKTHIYQKSLHDKYGPTVRFGPNELSTTEKELIPMILGGQGMPKGFLWDGRRFAQTEAQKDYDNIVDLRDPDIHAQLRKPWNKAFTAEPMKDYEELLIPRVMQLISQLKEVCAKSNSGVGSVDMAKWVSCFAFDFIGDMAFGGGFELMREGDKYGYFAGMEKALYLPSITQHVPWIATTLRGTPYVGTGMQNFIKFGIEQAIRRSTMEMKRKDLFYHISEASESEGSDFPLIVSNALLAIVAGSDTSSSVMSSAIYLLLSHPETYKCLQAEVDEAFAAHGIPDLDVELASDAGSLAYLNAVLNEALRLYPAVPTSLQRAPVRGSQGKLIQAGEISIFLPDGNAILVPPYVIHRDPRYFSPSPEAFIPERWLTTSQVAAINKRSGGPRSSKVNVQYTTTRDAFIPFSLGPQNCAGRAIALTELRYVAATLARNFDMEFDPGYDPKRWDAELEDRFTFAKGELGVRLRLRSKGNKAKV
ncbi:cytochrome P450 [Crassisporium funariophilum]|nr:cytochrome P450 [Crassisporium funariophilum]